MRVADVNDESYADCSDAFSLLASEEAPDVEESTGPTIAVTSPSEGDSAEVGEEYTVEVRPDRLAGFLFSSPPSPPVPVLYSRSAHPLPPPPSTHTLRNVGRLILNFDDTHTRLVSLFHFSMKHASLGTPSSDTFSFFWYLGCCRRVFFFLPV